MREEDYVDPPWWDEEDDEWSEKAYYESLADHFKQKYTDLIILDGELWVIDCE